MGFPTGSPTLWKLRWALTFSFTLHLFWKREENCVCIPNTSRTSTVWRCHIKMTHGSKEKKKKKGRIKLTFFAKQILAKNFKRKLLYWVTF